jgi:hypothetical protein
MPTALASLFCDAVVLVARVGVTVEPGYGIRFRLSPGAVCAVE